MFRQALRGGKAIASGRWLSLVERRGLEQMNFIRGFPAERLQSSPMILWRFYKVSAASPVIRFSLHGLVLPQSFQEL